MNRRTRIVLATAEAKKITVSYDHSLFMLNQYQFNHLIYSFNHFANQKGRIFTDRLLTLHSLLFNILVSWLYSQIPLNTTLSSILTCEYTSIGPYVIY